MSNPWKIHLVPVAWLRRLSILLPVLSVLVSGGSVMHQYARRATLRSELRRTEREMAALAKRLPAAAQQHPHHDD